MHCNGKCFFMRKVKEAQESEKKQDRANQQNHFQEALPPINPVVSSTFCEEICPIVYSRTITPATTQREYAILLPPKLV